MPSPMFSRRQARMPAWQMRRRNSSQPFITITKGRTCQETLLHVRDVIAEDRLHADTFRGIVRGHQEDVVEEHTPAPTAGPTPRRVARKGSPRRVQDSAEGRCCDLRIVPEVEAGIKSSKGRAGTDSARHVHRAGATVRAAAFRSCPPGRTGFEHPQPAVIPAAWPEHHAIAASRVKSRPARP